MERLQHRDCSKAFREAEKQTTEGGLDFSLLSITAASALESHS